MKSKQASSPFRRFLRGLTNTCLLLLLPVQLTLCWVANLDHPTKLPDFLTERISTQLAEQGLSLQARNFWMMPDLTLAADDLSLGVDGMSGDIFTAARVEIALNPALLIAGQIEPTQVRLSGARLWCPASVARGGVRRPLIDTLTLDVTKEGRWLNLRSIQARGGKITCHLSGEVPTGLLRPEKDNKGLIPLSRRLADAFASIETAIDVAERSGGASVSLRCQGSSDGSAEISVQAVLGNDWMHRDKAIIVITARRSEIHIKGGGHLYESKDHFKVIEDPPRKWWKRYRDVDMFSNEQPEVRGKQPEWLRDPWHDEEIERLPVGAEATGLMPSLRQVPTQLGPFTVDHLRSHLGMDNIDGLIGNDLLMDTLL